MLDKDSLLCVLLNCGTSDFKVLDDVSEDLLEDAINTIRYRNGLINLPSLTDRIFERASLELNLAVKARAMEITNKLINNILSYAEEEKLNVELVEIEELHPLTDLSWNCNYVLDTQIGFVKNAEIYKKYFKDDIAIIEGLIGHEILDAEQK